MFDHYVQVVELLDGTISRLISGQGQLFVVSTRPMVVANKPSETTEEELARTGRAVVLIGQAPVKVVGACVSNEMLVPSGAWGASSNPLTGVVVGTMV